MSNSIAAGSPLQQLYDKFIASVKNQPLNATTAITFVTRAMQLVEGDEILSGPEKKQAVIDLITRLINETPLGAEEKALLLALPYGSIIDHVVAATKNQIKINGVVAKVEDKAKACGCFGK